jgi:hypothetical protein
VKLEPKIGAIPMTDSTETLFVKRDGWGDGPWSDELDRYDFRTRAGYPGLIVRNDLGNLCGYVGLPPNHPAYGSGYDDVDVDVHGGLTYAEACCGHICHVPMAGESDDVWWLGFDCAHGGDYLPMRKALAARFPYEIFERFDDVYRDVAYVRAEVERLANQLVTMAKPN